MHGTQTLAEICWMYAVTARTHIMLELDMCKQLPSVDAFALQQSPVKDMTERTMTQVMTQTCHRRSWVITCMSAW